MPFDLKTEADCRIVYTEIANGYSILAGDIFLKHNTELDNCSIEVSRRRYSESAGSNGLLSEKDKLALLAKHGHWSEKEEEDYQQKMQDLESMHFSLKKLIIPEQIKHLEGEIHKKEGEFQSSFSERAQLLGMTKEYYANKKAQEGHILHSFFRDASLKIPYFSEEEIDELSGEKVTTYIKLYRESHSVFFEKNFKRIAVCPFFINVFMLNNGSPSDFFGKPMIYLTIYQLSLFGRGFYYKNLLSDPDIKPPPEEYYDDLDNVIKWFDQQYSISLGKRTNNKLLSK